MSEQASEQVSKNRKLPRGMGYIVGNEAAERFSYYGMKGILVIFMTKYLLNSGGDDAFMSPEQAKEWYHNFASAVYFFPLIGALISDIFWGKYKTIITLSIVYCLGHLSLAFMDLHFTASILEPKVWLALGLGLIAIGSGGIKPCVSAHLGDQVDDSQKNILDDLFSYFYFSINFGSTLSTLAIPWVLEYYGPTLAFGIPGILMFIATVIFYMGRHEFIAVPPAGWQLYKDELFSAKGVKSLLGLGVLYGFIAVFWSLFDQTGAAWVLQAEQMDLTVNLLFYKFELLPSQVQVINPILVMMFIPIFTFFIYPFCGKFFKVTTKGKIGTGFFFSAASFALIALVEQWIQTGYTPSIAWHFWAYVLITIGEVLISITALEFSYTQAPNSMKSFIMAIFLLSISLGNIFTAQVNSYIQNPDGTTILEGASYYWFFVYLILGAGILFCIASIFYKEESYIQDHDLI